MASNITAIPTDFLSLYRTIVEMDAEDDFVGSLERLLSGDPGAASTSTSSTRKEGINRVLGRLAHNVDALADTFQIMRTMHWSAAAGTYLLYDGSTNKLTIHNDNGSGSNPCLQLKAMGIASKSANLKGFNLKFEHDDELATGLNTTPFVCLNITSAAGKLRDPARSPAEDAQTFSGSETTAENSVNFHTNLEASATRYTRIPMAFIDGGVCHVLIGERPVLKSGEKYYLDTGKNNRYSDNLHAQRAANIVIDQATSTDTVVHDVSASTLSLPEIKVYRYGTDHTSAISVSASGTLTSFGGGDAVYVDLDATSPAYTKSTMVDLLDLCKNSSSVFLICYLSPVGGLIFYDGISIYPAPTYSVAKRRLGIDNSDSVRIISEDTSAYNVVLKADGSSLTSDRSLKIDLSNGNRSLKLNENLTIGGGFDVTVTAEDVAGTITLDNINLEAEDTTGSGGSMKLISSLGGDATLSVEGTGAIVNQDTTTDANVTFNSVATNNIKDSSGNGVFTFDGSGSISSVAPIKTDIIMDGDGSPRSLSIKSEGVSGGEEPKINLYAFEGGAASFFPHITGAWARNTEASKQSANAAGESALTLLGQFWNQTSTNWDDGASIAFVSDASHGGQATDVPTKMVFKTAAGAGTDNLTRMTIKSNGNVGIGKDSPDSRLEVRDGATPQLKISYSNGVDGSFAVDSSGSLSITNSSGNPIDMVTKQSISAGRIVSPSGIAGFSGSTHTGYGWAFSLNSEKMSGNVTPFKELVSGFSSSNIADWGLDTDLWNKLWFAPCDLDIEKVQFFSNYNFGQASVDGELADSSGQPYPAPNTSNPFYTQPASTTVMVKVSLCQYNPNSGTGNKVGANREMGTFSTGIGGSVTTLKTAYFMYARVMDPNNEHGHGVFSGTGDPFVQTSGFVKTVTTSSPSYKWNNTTFNTIPKGSALFCRVQGPTRNLNTADESFLGLFEDDGTHHGMSTPSDFVIGVRWFFRGPTSFI